MSKKKLQESQATSIDRLRRLAGIATTGESDWVGTPSMAVRRQVNSGMIEARAEHQKFKTFLDAVKASPWGVIDGEFTVDDEDITANLTLDPDLSRRYSKGDDFELVWVVTGSDSDDRNSKYHYTRKHSLIKNKYLREPYAFELGGLEYTVAEMMGDDDPTSGLKRLAKAYNVVLGKPILDSDELIVPFSFKPKP